MELVRDIKGEMGENAACLSKKRDALVVCKESAHVLARQSAHAGDRVADGDG
jgi:hypothetical protein